MSTGFPNDAIDSNEFGPNPTPSVFEWLNKFEEFRGRVAIYGTWSQYDNIFNKQRSGLMMQTGWTLPKKPHESARDALLRELYATTTEFDEEDVAELVSADPAARLREVREAASAVRGLRRDRQLGASGPLRPGARQRAIAFDYFVKQLWETMQAMPEYRDTTTFIITTDHGRGGGLTEWKEHGVEEKGSENIWIAVHRTRYRAAGERSHVAPGNSGADRRHRGGARRQGLPCGGAAGCGAHSGRTSLEPGFHDTFRRDADRSGVPSDLAASHGAAPSAGISAEERLGTVSFEVSCAASVHAPFNRGVALLHDFWYYEAQRQFERIAQSDPACAMAHWGIAMSIYHQIWNRPDADTMAQGRAQMQKAAAPAAKTAREREYMAALSRFYEPGPQDYQARVEAYSAAMGQTPPALSDRHRRRRLLRAVAAGGRSTR